jgi:hypothetical protein
MTVFDSTANVLTKPLAFSEYLNKDLLHLLPEYGEMSKILEQNPNILEPVIFDVLEATATSGIVHKLPLLGLSFGSEDVNAPAITFVGGIHGIERIGSQVVLSYLHTLVQRAKWDSSFIFLLKNIRLNFLPVMNPTGMLLGTRANGNGVDLMRNAPIEATEKVPWFIGGQQFSRRFPWYRGNNGLELENQILINFLKKDCLHRQFNLVIDCHSGFGFKDRLWIPYAYRKRPPRHVANYYALYQLLQKTYPHNNYIVEPQSLQYTTHGDLWDHVGKIVKHEFKQPFLSLTLEMGSWNWVNKSPKQLFSYQGLFNPNAQHRWARVQRSHLVLFDFLTNAACNYHHWLPAQSDKKSLRKDAINHWYRTS